MNRMTRFLLRFYQDVSLSQDRILLRQKIFQNFDAEFRKWSHWYDNFFAVSLRDFSGLDLEFERGNKV